MSLSVPSLPSPTRTTHDVATVLGTAPPWIAAILRVFIHSSLTGWLRDGSLSLDNAFGSVRVWGEETKLEYILNFSRNYPAGIFVFRISDRGRECIDGNQRLLSLQRLVLPGTGRFLGATRSLTHTGGQQASQRKALLEGICGRVSRDIQGEIYETAFFGAAGLR
ncbi:hypothetical protein FA13DRAFT_1712678 [Coprinellus micaceus]|uniref:DUF262 domain-containing protein n=1 Tax=Coprinellus micaceus TaxID=71717 RepID=A0A4Y7SZL0_COPMI|nr:hypothetical protein FA13DRAFT_1712678 [Coprinellus micaceus]